MSFVLLAPSVCASTLITPFGVFTIPLSQTAAAPAENNNASSAPAAPPVADPPSLGRNANVRILSPDPDLAARFHPAFPSDPESYSEGIIQAALQTPGLLPHLQERLLEAYAQAPESERGSWSQFNAARAIKYLFTFDARNATAANLNRRRLQARIAAAVIDDNTQRRLDKFSSIFRTMEAGLPQTDTQRHVSDLARRGVTLLVMAQTINGTCHTAYLDDRRLARRVASVFLDLQRFLQDPLQAEASRERFREKIWDFARSGRPLTPSGIFALLEVNPIPQIALLKKAWRDEKVAVEILHGEEFDKQAAAYGLSSSTRVAFFAPGGSAKPDRIFIRDLSRKSTASEAELSRVVSQTANRLCACAHEGAGHWWDSSKQARDYGGDPERVDLKKAQTNLHERWVSEIMAYFAEYAWWFRNLDDDYGEISRRLGESPASFFQNLAERAYS